MNDIFWWKDRNEMEKIFIKLIISRKTTHITRNAYDDR